MKIVVFSTAYLPFVGGAELAIKEITDRLLPSEFSFDLVTLNLDRKQAREERIRDVRVFRLSCPKVLFPFRAFMHASNLHHAHPYDCVWSVMASYGGFAGLFFKYRFPNVPFVLTLQEGDSLSHIYARAFLIWPLFKRIFTYADKITAISNYLADWARKMGATCLVEVIPNGVDIRKFEALSSKLEEREEIRKKLGIQKRDKVVITASRLVEKNGVGDLVESLRYLPDSVKLVICGSGPLATSLKFKVESLKLGERVKFLGQIPHEQLPDYLHAADIFCRPSLSEGLGISFLEAMAAGLPVVATPVGGIPDFLISLSPLFRGGIEGGELLQQWKNKITGLFCKVHNPKDIAEKVKLLLSNDELRTHIIANASKMVRERYGWDGIAEKMKTALT